MNQLSQPNDKKEHEFNQSLQDSNDPSICSRLNCAYAKYFKEVESVETVTDLKRQLEGMDKILHCAGSKLIIIDEKIRKETYSDILLEEYSNFETKKKGWLLEEKKTDYIAYVRLQKNNITFLPYKVLRKMFLDKHDEWLKTYGRREAKNWDTRTGSYYTTTNIPVPQFFLPIGILLEDLSPNYYQLVAKNSEYLSDAEIDEIAKII